MLDGFFHRRPSMLKEAHDEKAYCMCTSLSVLPRKLRRRRWRSRSGCVCRSLCRTVAGELVKCGEFIWVDMTVSGDGQVTWYHADATFHDPLSGSIDNYDNFHFTVAITYQDTTTSGSGFLTIYTPTGHMVGTIYFLGHYYQPDMVRASQ